MLSSKITTVAAITALAVAVLGATPVGHAAKNREHEQERPAPRQAAGGNAQQQPRKPEEDKPAGESHPIVIDPAAGLLKFTKSLLFLLQIDPCAAERLA